MRSLLKELGVSDKDTLSRVIPPMVHREDIAEVLGYTRHDGTPVGALVPEFVGQKVFDYTNKDFYIGVDTALNTDWAVLTLDQLSAAEIAFIDGVTAGTAAASKAMVLGTTKNISSFRMTGKLFTPQAAPETSADTATLTDAQMLSGILVATPTAAANYTVRTGAQLEAAVLAAGFQLQNGDCFDLTIINIGGSADDITLLVAAGITFVGEVVLRPGADAGTEHGGQGTWRFRRTAADTFIAYRVA